MAVDRIEKNAGRLLLYVAVGAFVAGVVVGFFLGEYHLAHELYNDAS